MNETYDPIPDLAHLLCAVQRQPGALGGLTVPAERLREALGIPGLAYPDEAETAIRKALKAAPATLIVLDEMPLTCPIPLNSLTATHQGIPVDARDNIPEER